MYAVTMTALHQSAASTLGMPAGLVAMEHAAYMAAKCSGGTNVGFFSGTFRNVNSGTCSVNFHALAFRNAPGCTEDRG